MIHSARSKHSLTWRAASPGARHPQSVRSRAAPRTLALLALALVPLLTGCFTPQVALPPEASTRLARTLAGSARTARVSLFVTPFFGDATRRLLTAVPPEQVRLLSHPNGTPVDPGPVERIIPAGTPARIRSVEFPTSFTMQERVLYTPRTLVWVTVDLSDTAPGGPSYVLVLRPGLSTEAELESELERYLSLFDVGARLEALGEPTKAAVRAKSAQVGMSREALEMAWGYPERKRLSLEGTRQLELWIYPGERRTAKLADGRVTELTP